MRADMLHRSRRKAKLTLYAGMFGFGLLMLLGITLLIGMVKPELFFPDLGKNGPIAPTGDVVQLQTNEVAPWQNVGGVQRRSGVQIRVDSAVLGEVKVKNAANEVQQYGNSEHLQFTLEIKNLSKRDVSYLSWLDTPGVRGKLVDDQGRTYTMLSFENVRSIQGHTDKNIISGGSTVRDVVIFTPPVNAGGVKYYRLELPASAVGGTQSFRFEIPAKLVSTSPLTDADLDAETDVAPE